VAGNEGERGELTGTDLVPGEGAVHLTFEKVPELRHNAGQRLGSGGCGANRGHRTLSCKPRHAAKL
jgi:hypothetical protein